MNVKRNKKEPSMNCVYITPLSKCIFVIPFCHKALPITGILIWSLESDVNIRENIWYIDWYIICRLSPLSKIIIFFRIHRNTKKYIIMQMNRYANDRAGFWTKKAGWKPALLMIYWFTVTLILQSLSNHRLKNPLSLHWKRSPVPAEVP